MIALDPHTGKLNWHHQITPHNLNDWDATQTPMLVDTDFRGQPRKLLVQPNRNGFLYVLDRLTGEFLLGAPLVHNLTWASGMDAKRASHHQRRPGADCGRQARLPDGRGGHQLAVILFPSADRPRAGLHHRGLPDIHQE